MCERGLWIRRAVAWVLPPAADVEPDTGRAPDRPTRAIDQGWLGGILGKICEVRSTLSRASNPSSTVWTLARRLHDNRQDCTSDAGEDAGQYVPDLFAHNINTIDVADTII